MARELFYRDGIRAVGVEAIAAAAGTNKMTLYRHFASKDELVAAYLQELAGEGEALWEEAKSRHPGDAEAQLRYLLRRASQFAAESSGRGCALANAAIELAERKHPARKVVEAHKRRQCERLVALVREADTPIPNASPTKCSCSSKARASACRASAPVVPARGCTRSPKACSTPHRRESASRRLDLELVGIERQPRP